MTAIDLAIRDLKLPCNCPLYGAADMPPSDKSSSNASAVVNGQEIRVAPHAHRIAVPTAGAPAPPPIPAPATSPTVEPIRDGDQIIGVEVTCTCGQKTRIAFEPAEG